MPVKLLNAIRTPINKIEFESLNKGYQILHDCYLVSSLKSLNKSTFGRDLLSQSVKKPVSGGGGVSYEVVFHGVKNKNKFLIEKDGNYKKIWWRKEFDLLGAMECATDRLIKSHPSYKSMLSRLFSPISKRIEYNKAGKFLKILTGKEPVQIGENGVLSLFWRKNKALDLMEKISNTADDKHSFVASTLIDGCDMGLADNHYYIIARINTVERKLFLGNPRNPEELREVSFERFFKNFRSIVGYFEDTVKRQAD